MTRQRLHRRRYAELVKFLRETLNNPKASIRVRLSAAARLDSVLERIEIAETRQRDRADRQEAVARETAEAAAAQSTPTTPDAQEPIATAVPDPVASIFSLLLGTEATHAD